MFFALKRLTSVSVHYLKETVHDFKMSFFLSDRPGKMCGVYASHFHFKWKGLTPTGLGAINCLDVKEYFHSYT